MSATNNDSGYWAGVPFSNGKWLPIFPIGVVGLVNWCAAWPTGLGLTNWVDKDGNHVKPPIACYGATAAGPGWGGNPDDYGPNIIQEIANPANPDWVSPYVEGGIYKISDTPEITNCKKKVESWFPGNPKLAKAAALICESTNGSKPENPCDYIDNYAEAGAISTSEELALYCNKTKSLLIVIVIIIVVVILLLIVL